MNFKEAQQAYDNMSPPEDEYCDACKEDPCQCELDFNEPDLEWEEDLNAECRW